ncbi:MULTISPECIES: hypothetical protein [Xanthomonas]|uniref:hypothetical protein n=1 Tax=Xanthomonas TaxID=338 RepID=UPI00111C1132|nr:MULTISPECIES: hypothetical protein [Xanthomonas]MBO9748934.1 hypothetical protein [Xanthomonas phaseoli pv. dieffenbachiae]MBO9752752.1 hypothetical protein [Xanthomonas phaseoli pv. dieffenbachiae]MBO9879496.1 hypothetical protein [Xanthomonas sp. D-99]MBO9891089.1 hypothetical protein [Xanthomonas sp. D-36-1]
MAFRPDAHKELIRYISSAGGQPPRQTIRKAIILTSQQQSDLTTALRQLWGSQTYVCALQLDLKPQHGYNSRVLKDGFSGAKYVEWLVAGCSDTAVVGVEKNGRPHLLVPGVIDGLNTFDIVVPIRSDALGYVHIDDVIPKGLPSRNKPSK